MGRFLHALFIKLPAIVADGVAALRRVAEPLALVGIVLLGIHGATNLLDDVVFGLIDVSDRAIDATVAAALGWSGARGWITAGTAASWSDGVALFVDIDRKEALAVGLALVVELLLDLALVLWCLPPLGQPAAASSSASAGNAQTAFGRVRMLWLAFVRHAPDALRALAVAFAFVLGAFAIGRWASGQSALLLAAPVFGPNAPGLAQLCGVLAAGLALFAVLPLGVRRAAARARATTYHRPTRALILPLIAAALLAAAMTSGSPGQAVRGLFADAAENEPVAATQPESAPSSAPSSAPASDAGAGDRP
ncbi:MAG: hypothetical protein JXR83_16165 [Deltaproteobacteria bacterium]|nr:hypothetical protein [Deltaproteobacteria bacterium]